MLKNIKCPFCKNKITYNQYFYYCYECSLNGEYRFSFTSKNAIIVNNLYLILDEVVIQHEDYNITIAYNYQNSIDIDYLPVMEDSIKFYTKILKMKAFI